MKRTFIIASLVAVIVGLVYLGIAGKTDSWPKAQCRVVSSRVVREAAQRPSGRSPLVLLYTGQFELQYIVGGRSYYVWANAGWSDKDERFVQKKIEDLPEQCPYYVQYNPRNPVESFVHSDSN